MSLRTSNLTLCLSILLLLITSHTVSAQRVPIGVDQELNFVKGHPAVANQVIVKFRSTLSSTRLRSIKQSLDVTTDVPVGGTGTRLLYSKSKDASSLLVELSGDPDVVFAEPNYLAYGGVDPNDTLYNSLYGLKNTGQTIFAIRGTFDADIDADEAWNFGTGTREYVVGVIDSGIDYNHPDLAANVWSAPAGFTVNIGGISITCPAGSHGFNAITSTCDPMDDHNHGTHVSGTVGAVGNNGVGVAGVNWTTSIMAAKWLNASNVGSIAHALNAIEFTIQAKQAFGAGANVRVLNNSWFSNAFSTAIGDQITRAHAAGMLFVALAGNNATDNDVTPRSPSGHKVPNVIGVLATNNSDFKWSASNWGKTTVHIGAPGEAILSTVRNNQYNFFSGTSMATPHVAGAAALLLSRCPLTIAGVKGVILTTADSPFGLANLSTTGGRLNVNNAMQVCIANPNVVEEARFFVRQHYVDFLDREPDKSGMAFWVNEITSCGGDSQCIEVKRINVSAAFFLSIEFQETGYYVYRLYKAAFGNIPEGSVPVRLSEFSPDRQRVGLNVVVGATGWEQQLENNKSSFATEFVSRTRFLNSHATSQSPATFVNTLFANAGVVPTDDERNQAIAEFAGAANISDANARGRALRRVADNGVLKQQELNRAFVLSQYFGYLLRNPYDAPEPTLDFSGYNFWLNKLNQFGGNFVNAEMVKAFILSGEFRNRFGP